MEDLLLKDYAPRSSLVVDEHLVERPRFPVVDVHNHLGARRTDSFGDPSPSGLTGSAEDVEPLVRMMDQCGVRAIVNLTGLWGDDLKRLIEQYEGGYPGRFVTFANLDWRRAKEPGFGEWAARQLEDSVRAGAHGLKVFKGLGLKYRDGSGKLLSPDDERLDPIWAKAGELGVPVLIHIADPVDFFRPLDRHNESYLALLRYPEWHFFGSDYPSFQELVDAGIRLIARHPSSTFVTAHTGWYSENLRFVGESMLDRLPNMYTDFSARLAILGRQPRMTRDFFVKYQDRVLFGTDATPSQQVYRLHFRVLETEDDCIETHPGAWRRIYGVALPAEVLEKVYHKNAERLIPGLI